MYRLQSSTIWNLLPLLVAQSQVKVQWQVLSAGHCKWLAGGSIIPRQIWTPTVQQHTGLDVLGLLLSSGDRWNPCLEVTFLEDIPIFQTICSLLLHHASGPRGLPVTTWPVDAHLPIPCPKCSRKKVGLGIMFHPPQKKTNARITKHVQVPKMEVRKPYVSSISY